MASTFSQLSALRVIIITGHANSPGNRAYFYAEFAISFLAVAVTIANTVLIELTHRGWQG